MHIPSARLVIRRAATLAACAGAALLLAGVPAQASAQSVLLRLAPENGLVSQYRMDMEMNLEMPGMPMNGPFMRMTAHTTQTVTGIEGDVIEYTMVTDSSTIDSPGMAAMQAPMGDLDGTTQTLRMDTRGRIVGLDVEGMTDEAQQIIGQLSGIRFSLPEGEVSPGDTWSATVSIDTPGMAGGGSMSLGMEMNYTFVGMTSEGGAQLATVRFEGPVTMSGAAGGMGIDGSGTASGMVVLDVSAGRLTEAENTMNLSLTIPGAGMSISQSMVTTLQLVGG